MNSLVAVFQRAGRQGLALTVLCGALLGGSTRLPAEPARTPNRFLFVIDTSAGMKPFESSVREAMFDFIYSGLRGQMTNNDTYGLWLVNEQNDTSFPMETWRQKFTVEMAAKTGAHIKNHGFKGRLNLNQVQADLGNVIKNVDDLMIILITNGETPISGTPFDDAINVRFRELATGRKKVKAAIFTTFAARDGVLHTWAPSSPEGEIRFPVMPPRPKVAKAEVAAETLVAAPPSALVPVPAKPKAAAPSIIITKESVAQEKKSYQAMTTIVTNEPVAVPAVAHPVVVQTPPPAPHAVSDIPLVESKPVTVVTNPVPPAPGAVVKNAPTAPETNMAMAVTVTPPSPVNAAAIPAAPPVGAVLWAVIGAGSALICVLVGFLACRSRRPTPSLISQSLVRERAGQTPA